MLYFKLMNAQELSSKVNEAINLWAKCGDKLVIAIDGYTGVGKTTLLNNLVNLNPDIIAVNWTTLFYREKFFLVNLRKQKTSLKYLKWKFAITKNWKIFCRILEIQILFIKCTPMTVFLEK